MLILVQKIYKIMHFSIKYGFSVPDNGQFLGAEYPLPIGQILSLPTLYIYIYTYICSKVGTLDFAMSRVNKIFDFD